MECGGTGRADVWAGMNFEISQPEITCAGEHFNGFLSIDSPLTVLKIIKEDFRNLGSVI